MTQYLPTEAAILEAWPAYEGLEFAVYTNTTGRCYQGCLSENHDWIPKGILVLTLFCFELGSNTPIRFGAGPGYHRSYHRLTDLELLITPLEFRKGASVSSNMYGFTCTMTCTVDGSTRDYFVQIVYVGTEGDSEDSRERATANWESEDPVELAKYEIAHRKWEKRWCGEARLIVQGVYAHWTEEDTAAGRQHGPAWTPPVPPDRAVLDEIATGRARNVEHGWDT
jgi:hypothetical protein